MGASEEFWKIFPSLSLPEKAISRVLVNVLQKKLDSSNFCLKQSENIRGQKVVESLKFGASSCQKGPLPPCFQKNAKNAITYGAEVTDTVASWVKKGFACGPFINPPLDKFRVNCLMAIAQGPKVRPVLNGSLPEGGSFNDNVKESKVEKVIMCSARCFSYSICEAGKGAWISKLDMQDAYKNVPCPIKDLHLQGFYWLERFFLETRQIFGTVTAVSNYDALGWIILALVLTECSIPEHFVHRQVDDVPAVAPFHKKDWCEEFTSKYKSLCNELNILLAADCPRFDKAFSCTQMGKILGIVFNTVDLTWKYPEDKTEEAFIEIRAALSSHSVNLKQMQCLMGRLNDVSLMAPFLRCFKGPLNEVLSSLQSGETIESQLPEQAKKDLLVWAGFLAESNPWKPISPRPMHPPISSLSFASDAAGFSKGSKQDELIGVGGIGFDQDGFVSMAFQIFWPKSLKTASTLEVDNFGDRSLMLEMVGLLLPFLLTPSLMTGRHVILKVDNLGCIFAWQNRNVAKDKMASIMVRALVLISSYLACYIHVEHLPRMTSWDAQICDRLSRQRTTLKSDKQLVDSFGPYVAPDVLMEWLSNPVVDWSKSVQFLNYVKYRYAC